MEKNQGLEFREMLKVYIGGSIPKVVELAKGDWKINMAISLMVFSKRVS